jgi:hypothetical protein
MVSTSIYYLELRLTGAKKHALFSTIGSLKRSTIVFSANELPLESVEKLVPAEMTYSVEVKRN